MIGKLRTVQWQRRLKALQEIQELLAHYDRDLRDLRKSVFDSLANKGELAESLLENRPIKGLLQEDQGKLEMAFNCFKHGSFRESQEASGEILAYLDHAIKKMQEDIASSGKALPLVTGAIGLLIAVLLF